MLERRLKDFATPDPADGEIDPSSLFARPLRAYWLEVGFGSGEHLLWQAAANPDVGLIGAEPFVAGVATCLAGLDAAGLDNVRLHADDARPLLAALPAGTLERIFVLQPDPWRKRRHWERRLIGPAGLDLLARALADGGELRASTDHPGYQTWMLRWLQADSRFEWLAATADDWLAAPDDWPETRYAAKARREGRKVIHLRYRRCPRRP